MKKLLAAGGLAGFSLGALSGLMSTGTTWPSLLLRASVSALVAGLLMRWWGGLLGRCLQEAHQQRKPEPSSDPFKPLSTAR